ncbi:trehalose-6-phosphate phosphatase family protein [Dorcoceras hygrometricum]|uniref:Trehalose-6-phosphate phosphatase family protein n=1 Tax=Dorcoceras hygrometricum TaxID=472368 RepID=A0A2Z7C101_9LAMI|nr:trehalose-6-phosphate phosphatase family protein [Dorcoceras hygrometricum]
MWRLVYVNQPRAAMLTWNPDEGVIAWISAACFACVWILAIEEDDEQSKICPADGSQYKQSAVGLVFMESAAGLAMETSKVESAVRNQAEAKLNQLEHNKPAETMTTSCNKEKRKSWMTSAVTSSISSRLQCIQQEAKAISSCEEMQEMKRRRTGRSISRELQCNQQLAIAKRCLPVQARRRKTLVYVVSHTVAAVVHLWSLGVLTAVGCGIGSIHEVVRSNLLVEPSEVEEGEM